MPGSAKLPSPAEATVRRNGGAPSRCAVTKTPAMALPLSSVTVPRMLPEGFVCAGKLRTDMDAAIKILNIRRK